jgi:hypothetical protein
MNMKPKNQTITASILFILALAGSPPAFAADTACASEKGDSSNAAIKQPGPDMKPGTAALRQIKVSFKLDPRLTKGLYMGDRWVSPPSYTRIGEGSECTVEARAYGLEAKRRPMNISPKWIPADPDMLTVTPSQGNEVKIIVKRAGQTSLDVVSQGVRKTLSVKAAVYLGTALSVEIKQ